MVGSFRVLCDRVPFRVVTDRVLFMVLSDKVLFRVLNDRILFRVHKDSILFRILDPWFLARIFNLVLPLYLQKNFLTLKYLVDFLTQLRIDRISLIYGLSGAVFIIGYCLFQKPKKNTH